MLTERGLTVASLRNWAYLRNTLLCTLIISLAWIVSVAALSRGITTSVLLLLAFPIGALCMCILWKPAVGLYAGVLLNVAMDGQVEGDPISEYTAYFHENLNTFAHAGVAFSPLELLLLITTLAYLLRAIAGQKPEGGTLAKPMLAFGMFLIFGFVWGFSQGGDWKIGFFEVRGPILMVLLYFLVTNLIRDHRQLEHVLGALMIGLGILAIWTVVRLVVLLHGHSGGPDGVFGINHEDAVFLGYYAVICLVRLVSAKSRHRPLYLLLLLLGLVMMLEMQRRAASVSLILALMVLAITIFYRHRRVFLRGAPFVVVLVAIYSGAFWNSNSTWAQPLRAIRTSSASSSIDPRDLSSNLYRVLEMANVRDTIRIGPLTGVGFGRPYLETHPVMHFADFQFQFYTPHAEVFWIWLKVGAIGFVAFWTLVSCALLRSGDLIRRVGTAPLGFACLTGVLFIVMLLAYSYVDIGLANIRCETVFGTALGTIGTATRLWRGQGANEQSTTIAPVGSGFSE